MTRSTVNHIMRNALNAAIYLIFAMLAIVLFVLGPKIEALIHPVVGAFKIESVWQEEHDGEIHYYMQGAMLKFRGECEPTEVVMFTDGGLVDANGKIVKIDFEPDPMHITNELISRPEGAQHWGPWRLIPPREPIGPIISLMVRHQCHALWQQSQVIYTGLTKDIFPGLVLDTSTGG